MDEMQIPDLSIATKYLEYAEVVSWNQIRHVMLTTIKPYLKRKNMTAEEFFPLPIDKEYDHNDKTTEVDPAALAWWKKMKSKNKEE